MLFDTTQRNNNAIELSNDLVGKPFSVFKAIRIGGVGSKKMIIEDCSNNIQVLLNNTNNKNYCSIELRPNGILVLLNIGLQNFTWAIAFKDLTVEISENITIKSKDSFISVKRKKSTENNEFFKKLNSIKVKNQLKFNFIEN